jgi:Protein of unknown function (DUF3489)
VIAAPGAKGTPRSCPAGFIAEVGLRRCGTAAKPNGGSLMAKSKKRAPARSHGQASTAKPPLRSKALKPTRPLALASLSHHPSKKASKGGGASKLNDSGSDTKQSRVLTMLRSPAGATIAAIMRATGWQQHSVRGFLAGVVRKRFKLELISKKVDGNRVYQIGSGRDAEANSQQPRRRAA